MSLHLNLMFAPYHTGTLSNSNVTDHHAKLDLFVLFKWC